ncbi:hypothetical protein LB506_006588 [Fusarium annulatum]|nr:hypothetical protein LB506_006588 [Fusarium annulatum]
MMSWLKGGNSASFLHKVFSKTHTQIHIYIYFEKGEGVSVKTVAADLHESYFPGEGSVVLLDWIKE